MTVTNIASWDVAIKNNDFLEEEKKGQNSNATSLDLSASSNEAQRDIFSSSTTIPSSTDVYSTEQNLKTDMPQSSTIDMFETSNPNSLTEMTTFPPTNYSLPAENIFEATTERTERKSRSPTLNLAIITAVTFTSILNILNMVQYICYYLLCKRSHTRNDVENAEISTRAPNFQMKIF